MSSRLRGQRNGLLELSALEERVNPTLFVVTSLADSGPGSFRQAIVDANALPGADELSFLPSLVTTPQVITLSSGQIEVTDAITITGPGVGLLTLSGNFTNRILSIAPMTTGSAVNISGLTLIEGRITNDVGGAISSKAAKTNIAKCVFTNNRANTGGAVHFDDGTLSITDCHFSKNTAYLGAGGAVAGRGTEFVLQASLFQECTGGNFGGAVAYDTRDSVNLLVNGCSFIDNATDSDGRGGAICFFSQPPAGDVTVRNSTFVNNHAYQGGAILIASDFARLLLENSTVYGNTANRGGGIARYSTNLFSIPIFRITSSVVSGNTTTFDSPDIYGFDIYLKNSALGIDSGITHLFDLGGNIPLGSNLGLFPVSNIVGLHWGMMPATSSILRNRGINEAKLTYDQRGPGFPRVLGDIPDIGAIESPNVIPIAVGSYSDIFEPGAAVQNLVVAYDDDQAIQVNSLNTGDILVSGPNDLKIIPIFVSVDQGTNGSPRVATYQFTPPGGTWDSADDGAYTVTTKAGEVSDNLGYVIPELYVGRFNVLIPHYRTVNNNADSGPGSLRQAVADANSWPGRDVITFDPVFFSTPRTIPLSTGQMKITETLTIQGPGAQLLTIDALNNGRHWLIDGPQYQMPVEMSGITLTKGRLVSSTDFGGSIEARDEALTLRDMTITGNYSAWPGGALSGSSQLLIERSIVSNNTANERGGALWCFGEITIRDSWFANNTSSGAGGAIYGYNVTIENSTFSGNKASEGAVLYWPSHLSHLSVRNSTFSGNVAQKGAVFELRDYQGEGRIENCTFVANKNLGESPGAAIHHWTNSIPVPASKLTIESCVFYGSTRFDPAYPGSNRPSDVYTEFDIDISYSLIGAAEKIGSKGTGNLPIGTNAKIGPLVNAGGIAPVHVPAIDSPMVNAGTNPSGLAFDQRGIGFPRQYGAKVDIGAVEIDNSIPQATGPFGDLISATTSDAVLNVTYYDDVGIKVNTLGTGDIRVTGPNGFDQIAKFQSVNLLSDGTPRVATYTIAALGGAWDTGDNGVYTVHVQPAEVFDTSGLVVQSAAIGTFEVKVANRFIVTNVNDKGNGSLRQAVIDANLSTGADTITFDPVFFTLPRTISFVNGPIAVTGSTSLIGPGSQMLTLDGQKLSRLLTIASTTTALTVAISGVTFAKGQADQGGAVFISDETVTLDSCRFTDNQAKLGGGAIALTEAGSITISNSLLTNNSVTSGNGGALEVGLKGAAQVNVTTGSGNSAIKGGAIAFSGTQLLIDDSTFYSNMATNSGAVLQAGGGTGLIRVRNSTLSGNIAANGGAAMCETFDGTLQLQNCTLTANQGGGIRALSGAGTIKLESSVVAGNSAPDISAKFAVFAKSSALGFDPLISSYTNQGGNLPNGIDVKLGPLADNGGATLTHAPLAGSPLINAGYNAAGTSFDQRGIGYPRLASSNFDIGAVEIDYGAPQAKATLPAVVSGATEYLFAVTYTDDNAIAVSTLGTGDVRVTGPNSFVALPVLTAIDNPTNGSPRVAAYRLTPPDGTWNPIDNGLYTWSMQPLHVYDITGSVVPPIVLGAINIAIPPDVTGVIIGDGTTQRSRVLNIVVTFNAPVTLPANPADAFVVTGPSGTINLSVLINNEPSGTAATLSFSGPGLEHGSLADGDYNIRVLASKVSYGSLAMSADRVESFHRLFGDSNGDRKVSAFDFAAFRTAYGSADPIFDFDGSGIVTAADFARLRLNYGIMLP